MTIEEAIVEGQKYLHKDQVKLLLSSILEYNPLELYNHLKEELSDQGKQTYQHLLGGAKNNKPLQYLMGTVSFYGFEFKVDENVLIPRFETEELVEQTLKLIDQKKKKHLKVIDLGCGSGVIGITLKKFRPSLDVTLLDISKDALRIAKENAQRLNVEVTVKEGNMLDNETETYDVIISNPPYIKEKEELDSIVYQNEPHIALFGGKDGLDYYRQILKEVPSHVKEDYIVAFEMGMNQKESLVKLIEQSLKNVKIEVKNDLEGRNRMVFVTSKEV